MIWISYLIILVFVMIAVAFVKLIERNILGLIQVRSGPNVLGVLSLLQPFSDAIKLFSSEQLFFFKSNSVVYYVTPFLMMLVSFSFWMLYLTDSYIFDFEWGGLFFLCLSGLNVYGMLISGWSSNSIYSLLGSLRALSQAISYEVSMVFIMMSVVLLSFFDFYDMLMSQCYVWFMFINIPLFFCWVSSILAETNRLPFDFAEGESELVSGFNVEYGGSGFAFIFMSEYMNIIFVSMLSVLMFLGGNLFYLSVLFMVVMFIWIRGVVVPRMRYDKLMSLSWKIILPKSLSSMLYIIGLYASNSM